MAAVLEEGVATPETHVVGAQPAPARRPPLQGRHRPRHLEPDAQRRTRQVQQHRHHPGRRAARQDRRPGRQRPLLLPAQVRHRLAQRTRLPRRDPGHPGPPRASGPPRSSTRSRSARASRSTRMQAASVYSTIANGGVRVEPTLVRGTKGARRALHARARAQADAGSSARRPPRRCRPDARVGRRRRRGHRHQGRHPRLPGRGQDRNRQPGRPARPAPTRATPRPSRASPPPTTPGSPSTAPSRTPPRAATSAARSADPSTSRSWSSRSRPSRSRRPEPSRPTCPSPSAATTESGTLSDNHHPGPWEPGRDPGRRAPLFWRPGRCARYAHRRATR